MIEATLYNMKNMSINIQYECYSQFFFVWPVKSDQNAMVIETLNKL